MARKPASEQPNTLEDIRDAAFGLFGRHGYDGVSLAKVADAANITKAAIYWHYNDKLDLYIDCTRQFYEIFRLAFDLFRTKYSPVRLILQYCLDPTTWGIQFSQSRLSDWKMIAIPQNMFSK